MKQLPESYLAYLEGKDEDFTATVLPILRQSAADQLHGVKVVQLPHGVQAHLDDAIPFGQVREDSD
ncbi:MULTISPECIES: hypothetical protein [unclassified Arthrobacter]|uniref:hypothetical protein n=1 Tax=unclassified Arthrobacter TaxID=235627 RepID=UPI00159D89A7|nr:MULTISPECIES: hypothetical protein [unclassified Arthrobacter]MCQ9163861.1 hypothetical protein [Arthrobacter sp. STN4]NVN00014.1 hypothetical protein [Arthrobacter sp. SDTb3-6]